MKKFFISLFILFVVVVGSGGVYVFNSLKPYGQDGDLKNFTVNPGDSLGVISKNLEDESLIKNSLVFRYYGRVKKYDQKLKLGKYELSSDMSVDEIYTILIEGKQNLVSVTIPEGYTSTKIAKILEDKGVVDADDFLLAIRDRELLDLYNVPFDSAEGFLYPDTYSFEENYPALRVVESFLKNFYKNLSRIYAGYNKLTPEQLAQKVVLASIVEREYKSRSEVKTISSVFHNRLKKGMRLESCATVIYVITEEKGRKHPKRLLYSDVKIPSQYNTYLNKGLPPSAISNPGFYALEASFYPEDTDYVFFVVKDRAKGLHSFSSSYSEHQEAAMEYIKGFESK